MDRSDWDDRYAASELVWGADPNRFVEQALAAVEPRGRALDLACGEGRNAIWLAERGWAVTGVDYSAVAIDRARQLAARRGVEVDWRCEDLATFAPTASAFALVVIAYLQVSPDAMQSALALAADALEPGGELFMIGHARRNLDEGVGGPQHPAVLWAPDEVEAMLREVGLEVERCVEVTRPVATAEGERDAIDLLVRAHRAA